MPTTIDFLKEVFANDEKAFDFYLNHASFGLFYFKKGNMEEAWADVKLHQFIGEGLSLSKPFNILKYFDGPSAAKMYKWQEQGAEQKKLELNWKVKDQIYKVTLRIHLLTKENVFLIGLANTTKVEQIPGEQYFNYIVQNATEGIMVFENEVLVYASPTFLSMLDETLENLIGNGAEWAFGLIHPEDKPNMLKIFEEIYTKKIPQKRYRFRVQKKSGEYIWREDHASFVFNEQGGIARSVVVAKEITHQIELEKELVKNEQIYRKLFDNVQIGLLITDAETNILEANEVATNLIGVPRDALTQLKVKQPSWVLYDENYNNVPYNDFPVSKTADTGKPVSPLKLGFKKFDGSGEEVWLDITSNPIFNEDGEIDKIVCTFLDVTEQHQAKTKIIDSNNELKLLREFVDSSTDGLHVIDESGYLVYLNREAADRLEIEKGNIKQIHVKDFEASFESEDDWMKHFAEIKEKGFLSLEGEHTNLLSGKTYPVEVIVKHANINNKEYAIASTRDITERKKAEREIISQARFPAENPNPVMRVNGKGKLLFFNHAAAKQLSDWNLQLHQPILLELRAITKEVFVNKKSTQVEVMIRGCIYSVAITYVDDQKYANIYLIDITEQREAEQQLQIEKQRLNNIIDGVKLGTWEWHVKQGRVDYNSHWAEMLGYRLEEVSPGSIELWSSMVHPEDLRNAEEAIEAHMNNETGTYEVEFRMKHKKGHWEWIASRGKIVARNIAHEPILFSGTHHNITERKKQEEELRLFESVIKNTKDAVIIAEAEPIESTGPQILFVNKAFTEMTGYSAEELIGNTPRILQGPKTNRKELDKIKNALKKWESFEAEVINYRKNGEPFWVNFSVTPLSDENGYFTHWIAIERDVTEQKEKEEELRLFESIIKETNDSVLITEATPNGEDGLKIIFANEAFCKMTGYSEKELLNRTTDFLRGPLTSSKTIKEIETSILKLETFEHEIINYKKNGKAFWLNLSATPLTNNKGEYTHWITIQRDITDQKRQDQKLLEAKEKAEAANIAKSEFLANMSHEIRTPLNSVIGFSELLMKTKLDSTQLDYMETVNYSANTLLDLINDILDFSKIEAGKLELNKERTDLFELLYHICEMIKFKLDGHKVELLLNIAADVPQFVWCDAVRLRQILVNLLSNAAKFTEKGEIEISVCVENKQLTTGQVALNFAIRDTGIGISAAKQATIFQAFAQEDTSTSRKYGGTGLGLSISNKLLSLMESALLLESEQGKGSKFFFNVAFESQYYPKEALQDIGLKKVLVVDDNERSLEILTNILTELGISSFTASNGIEALSKLQNEITSTDAVLIDFNMPFMSGEAVVKQIREELNISPEMLPVFIMHHYDNNSTKLQNITDSYKITGIVHKPVLKPALLSTLRDSLIKGKREGLVVAPTEANKNVMVEGKSILIVDDNQINRKLASSMIKNLYDNIVLYETEDGKSTLEFLKRNEVSIILMDIQMPGMSGYEVTGAIRKTQNVDNSPIIIALTAGTVKGERKRCLDAGMDDYMSKPITLEKLVEMLNKWMAKTELPSKMPNSKAKQKNEINVLQDFNYAKLLHQFENNELLIEDILLMIREGILREKIVKLEKYLLSDFAPKEIKSIAHSIKGTSLNLSFENLANLTANLEEMYPYYDIDLAKKLIHRILESYDIVEKIVLEEKYLNKNRGHN